MERFFILLTSLFFIKTCSYIHRVECWRYREGNSNEYMPLNLYLLHDMHRENKDVQFKQVRDVLHFLRQTGSSLILEENEQPSRKLNLYELREQINYWRHPFDYLSRLAAYDNIITSNVDFRTSSEDVDELKEITDREIQIICTYKDCPALTKFYKQVIHTHKTIFAPTYCFLYRNLDKLDHPHIRRLAQSIIDLYNPQLKIETLDKDKLITELSIYYNIEFVDAKTLHTINEHGRQGVQSIVVYEGGAHIRNIRLVLTELGYRLVNFVQLAHTESELLTLRQALHAIEPEYDPNAVLPKTKVDYLLEYIELEHCHPHWAVAIPATLAVSFISILWCLNYLFCSA